MNHHATYEPSPERIAEECARIQATWPPERFESRAMANSVPFLNLRELFSELRRDRSRVHRGTLNPLR